MTIVVGALTPDKLAIHQWSHGMMTSVTEDTLDAHLEEMLLKMCRHHGGRGDISEAAILMRNSVDNGGRYPQFSRAYPRMVEGTLGTALRGTPPRDELVTVSMPPAEMRVPRPVNGVTGKPETKILWPVKAGHISPTLTDDVTRARALSRMFLWARQSGRVDLQIVEGWADAWDGEIVTHTERMTPSEYIAACRSAGAPAMPGKKVDYRVSRSGELIEIPRARRKA